MIVTEIPDPLRYHREQLLARRTRANSLERSDIRLSQARLAVVVVFLALAVASLWQGSLSAWWLFVPLVSFVGLAVVHDRVIRSRRVADRGVRWYELGLARLEDRWVETGDTGERFQDAEHPYALDLDIFGTGSLFQLLTTAQTSVGEETLAAWLLTGADPETVRKRQSAVRDLSERPLLREDLYALGADARNRVDSAMLNGWATAPLRLNTTWLRGLSAILALGGVVTLAAWVMGFVWGGVPLAFAVVNSLVGVVFGKAVSQVLHGSSEPSRELDLLAAVIGRVRGESFTAAHLQELSAEFGAHADDPIRVTRRLNRLIQMHDWQHNLMFAPIAAVTLWGLQCALAVEGWRRRHGSAVGLWLRDVGEFEALSSLATYHFGRPEGPFPELVSNTSVPVYDAERLAHPLLPRTSAVANDVRLGEAPQLLVVSGSNMSGKTTLLRTVGANAVLAFAGGPVRAARLRVSPLVIGATLRVQDSLLEGRSRFYAELTRLRRLVELAQGPIPLLFLLDELFHGTNSHDRVEGAYGVLHFLVGLRAIGLVTTHDLALAATADRLEARASNVHFEDHFADGEMAFDYQLREGRATRSNALALMTAVGLHVSPSQQK
jgi:hypothetical protein